MKRRGILFVANPKGRLLGAKSYKFGNHFFTAIMPELQTTKRP
jgi:hypothetical protein